MDETVIVIMQKDEATGFLDKELASCRVPENEELIVNIYAARNGEADYTVHMKITTDRDAEDWEFDAIYDYYDGETLVPEVSGVTEIEDCFNPTWEITFPFVNDDDALAEKIASVLKLHKTELESVYEAIKDSKDEYTNEAV